VKTVLAWYRVLATVVGISIIVLICIGLPLDKLHTLSPGLFPVGSTGQQVGHGISAILGTAHGFIYIAFVFVAFALSRLARWSIVFTLVTLVSGTVPFLSFWAERRAIRRVKAQLAGRAADPADPTVGDRIGS
jgi:integral membrane protein